MSVRAAVRLEALGFAEVYRYADGKADWAAAGLPIEGQQAAVPRVLEIAEREVPTCRLADRLEDVRARDAGVCVVVDDHGVILGQVTASGAGQTAEDAMDPGPTTYRPNLSLEEAWARLEKQPSVQHVLVSTPDGQLLGLLRRQDLADVVQGQHTHEQEHEHEH